MFVVWVGLRMAGRVLDTGEYHVETRCAHLLGLPLVPLKSYLVIDPVSDAALELTELHGASVLAAYGRTWGPLLAVAGVAAVALGAPFPMNALYVAAGLAATVLGWRAGRLTDDDLGRYAVYAKHSDRAMDPALLTATERLALRDELRATVLDATAVYAGKGYRDTGEGPRDAWELVVLAAEVRDLALVERALTLARLEETLASSAKEKRRFGAAHAALWAKLRALRVVAPQAT